MINEEILKEWETHLYEVPFDIENVVELIAEVRRYNLLQKQFDEYQKQFVDTVECLVQTRREADWLAWNCETLSGYNPILRQGMSKTQWREAAREAVHDV